jgi:alpha-galactosidase
VYVRRHETWQQRYDSGVLRGGGEIGEVDVDIAGANALRLVVTDAGDNIHSDHGVWAGARLE